MTIDIKPSIVDFTQITEALFKKLWKIIFKIHYCIIIWKRQIKLHYFQIYIYLHNLQIYFKSTHYIKNNVTLTNTFDQTKLQIVKLCQKFVFQMKF